MNKDNYKSRVIDLLLPRYLATFGAVVVEGPKWCGKTWTSTVHSNSQYLLGSSEGNFHNRHFAEMSPGSVLVGDTPRLLDEWQTVPVLWDAVRAEVDARNLKGQFILTGSATPNRKGIFHSGAGRIGRIRMRPMSLFESGDSSGRVSLKDICEGKIDPALTGDVELMTLAKLIVRGGWPGNLTADENQSGLMADEYIRAVLESDIYAVDEKKRDARKMHLLLKSLARNESTTASNKVLIKDVQEKDEQTLSDEAVSDYINLLRRLFLVDNQLPFAPETRSSIRIKQSEKRHLADPSLACSLLSIRPAGLLQDLNTFGFLFEALCERDLRIYAESFGGKLYHYQDYHNQEFDAVIEMPDKQWCAIEIKLGAHQIDSAAENLLAVNRKIAENKGKPASSLCVICGLSNAAYTRPDGVHVVPITALKP